LNPGYNAVVIMVSLVVLSLCGWKREIVGVRAGRALFTVMCFIAVTCMISWKVNDQMTLQLSEGLYGGFVGYSFYKSSTARAKLGIVIAGLSIMFLGVFMAYAHRWSPISFIHPTWDFLLGVAVIASVLLPNPLFQFAALWIGMTFSHIWEQNFLGITPITLGDPAFQDRLWLAFLLTRGLSMLYSYIAYGLGWMAARNK